ncbi:CinA family protein [Hydrogenimonas urashimensis]|uniref:CinA family protein n=1 Tax=Hydrogenimonas urashimensis TaxID=2740515 RepID=UPI0019165128|nr:CinA family protein [Hydrogenimonas urashimensis]
MKNRVVIIGQNLYLNPPFMEYIERDLEHLGFLEQITKIPETSSDIVTLLQQQIDRGGNLILITNKNAFTPVSKLLATMIDDTLILKESMLIPSKSEIYDDNSFLVQYGGCTINVTMAEPGEALPMFLVEHREKEGTLHIFNMDEESATVLIEPLARTQEIDIVVTTLTPGWQQVECTSKRYGQLGNFLKSVNQLLKGRVIETTNIFAYLIHRLSQRGKTVTFAESCTGGLIAAQLTSEPGSSTIFRGSLVTYSNTLKAGWLGVEKEALETYGAVSEQCVEQMLAGAKEIAHADYALAVSGIAGPGGGTPQKPVGTVYIGAKSDSHTVVEKLLFDGDRNYIQKQSMLYAYKLLIQVASEDLFER